MTAILRVKDENGNIVSIPAIKGDKGEKGDRGLPGSGGVPDGGTTGQVLTKNSDADGDAGWKEPYTYVLPAATAQTLGGVKIGDGISIAEDGTISSEGGGSASAVLYTEQTLTDEQKTQALANIGGLSKSQGTANSGKFLGIGADGIVVPTEVGGGNSKNYRKIAEVTISEEVSSIFINKDINGNPFEITEYLVYGANVKATGATQITTSLNSTALDRWGWTGINGFIDATTAKSIYMESIWIGRRILRLNSSQWNNGTLSVIHKPNNDQYGNVEKISSINLIACTHPFSQGTITVWGG